jgi:ABC-type polysaccharide/polyol phosphate export permease
MISDSLQQLILVRFRDFFREPEALFWVYGFPLLLAAGLGLAFRDRPADRIVVGHLPGVSAQAIAGLSADSGTKLEPFADSAAGAKALRNGQIALLLVPDSTGLRYRYDDTRPDARMARQHVNDVVQRSAGRTEQVATGDQIVRERGSRYIDFLIPGLIGFNLMGSGIWGTGFTIVDARKRKLLKRLAATPMSRSEYLESFLISQLVLLVLAVGMLLLFGMLVFDVPVRGSFVTLSVTCAVAGLTFVALGLCIAARPRTVEAASGLMNLVMLPMWVFSGVFFSSSHFPAVMQPVIKALPLSAVNDALRAVMLEGAGLAGVLPELAVLGVWLVLSFALALKLFRWT